MNRFLDEFAANRESNADALAAFGVEPAHDALDTREVRKGDGPVVFTIGYERRDGETFVSMLVDHGIDVLVDVRQRAFSRKPDFRKNALRERCLEAGIEYQQWSELGSTDELRDELRETGDFAAFADRFRELAENSMSEAVERLGQLAESESIALMCYERCHHECHRSVITEMLGELKDATVIAI